VKQYQQVCCIELSTRGSGSMLRGFKDSDFRQRHRLSVNQKNKKTRTAGPNIKGSSSSRLSLSSKITSFNLALLFRQM
jgi:hypothetical protein